jgi:hypothetical protein
MDDTNGMDVMDREGYLQSQLSVGPVMIGGAQFGLLRVCSNLNL